MTNPCSKDCKERNAECHAKCERYMAYAEERRRQRNQRHSIVEIENGIFSRKKSLYQKAQKRTK